MSDYLQKEFAASGRPTHRHYKGGLYRKMMEGTMEHDMTPVVIYHGADNRAWVRYQADFDSVIGPNPAGLPADTLRFSPIEGRLEIENCVGCHLPVFEGDKGFVYSDGPICCEQCAPTLADLVKEYQEVLASPDALIDGDEIRAALAKAEARIAAGEHPDSKPVRAL